MPNHGKGGRPRKPNEMHSLEGTGRKDRGTKQVVKLVSKQDRVSMKPESILPEDHPVFKRIAQVIESYGMENGLDSMLVSAIVSHWEIYCEAQQLYKTEGIEAQVGRKMAINVMNEQIIVLHKLMTEFGLTPSSRSGLHAKEQAEVDPLDDVMQGFN